MASGASSAAAAGVAVMGMAARPAAVTAAARDRKVRRFNIRNSPRFDGLRRRSVPKRGSARDREAESRVQAAPGKRKAPARLERRDQIGRAQVCTPVTQAPHVCRIVLAKKKK